MPGNWTNGLSRAATDISIRRMSQSGHAEPLYLVTEISEVAADAAASDAAAKDVVTRGTPVTSTDNFMTTSDFPPSATPVHGLKRANRLEH